MANPEGQTHHERKVGSIDISERSSELQKQHELERQPDTRAERANEAHLRASKEALSTKEHQPAANQENETTGPAMASKTRLSQSFDKTMQHTRTQMSAPARAFSKIIHAPAVEKVSDLLGSTVARPDAVLSGSVTALLLTLALYLTARYMGFELPGSVTVAAFVVGWLLGVVFDILRGMLRTRR